MTTHCHSLGAAAAADRSPGGRRPASESSARLRMHAERLTAGLARQVKRAFGTPCLANSRALACTRAASVRFTSSVAPKNRSAGVDPSIPGVDAGSCMVDEQTNPLPRVAEVHEDGALPHSRHSVPQKRSILPASAAGAARPRSDGCPAFALLAEGTLATPGDVLRAVVRQHFLRHPDPAMDARSTPAPTRRLAGVQAVAHHVAAVVVEEGDQIDPRF